MNRIIYNKLVRDNIPSIIKQDGKKYSVRKLRTKEYKDELLKKLQEEAEEVLHAKNKGEIIKEIGDVEEVLMAIMDAHGVDCKEVTKIRNKRKKERGAFKNRVFLEWAEK